MQPSAAVRNSSTHLNALPTSRIHARMPTVAAPAVCMIGFNAAPERKCINDIAMPAGKCCIVEKYGARATESDYVEVLGEGRRWIKDRKQDGGHRYR